MEPSPAEIPGQSAIRNPQSAILRGLVESIVAVSLVLLVARTFVAEAYVVPTGSMAPTLLGQHLELTCRHCHFQFELGLDPSGRAGRPACPNCGWTDVDSARTTERTGDRLLVQKFTYAWRSPRRWEVVVFRQALEGGQAYVKRVVGLPGESVQIRQGDVYVDGQIARKSLDELRAARVLVHDAASVPAVGDGRDRWLSAPLDAWQWAEGRYVREGLGQGGGSADWLTYRHVDPDRSRPGPVRDFGPYNGLDVPADHRVSDLMVEAEVRVGPGPDALLVRLEGQDRRALIRIPLDGRAAPTVVTEGEPIVPAGARAATVDEGRAARLEAAWVDRRLAVAWDGVPLFEAIDFDPPRRPWRTPTDRPLAIGVEGPGTVVIDTLRVYRDLYYTGGLAAGPTRPFGVEVPHRLGTDEYFVLGDNSPISNDSRFWPGDPSVKAADLIGKPFLVHLPSRAVPLRVLGGPTYWVPDFREIRYIR